MRHKVLRPLVAIVLALGLGSTLTPAVAAQPSIDTDPITSAAALRADNEQESIDNASEAAATPAAGREDLEPAEPGFDDNTIDNDAGADWHATTDPEATITPGQMRSDTEDIPGGFTKEEADRAEVQEAAEQQAQQDRAANPLARALAAAPVNCTTYWPSPYKVCGAIREKYDAIGGPTSFLTWPKSDELGVPDGVGRRNEFVNGFIYWHPTTGAHPVTTHFSTVWARNGWEAGRLGYPTTDEFGLSDGIGRKQSFQRGHIYGSLAGLASIEGLIYDKWVATGAEGGPLGYPTTDEVGTPDGIGRYNHFFGGDIYWHPQYGAHPVSYPVLYFWRESGSETGEYGYPISDASTTSIFPYSQEFNGGIIDVADVDSKQGTVVPDPGTMGTCNPQKKEEQRNYVIQSWKIDGFGLNGKTGRLECGSDKDGYWHIDKNHGSQWKQNADMMGVHPKKLLGLAIMKSLTGPLNSTFDSSRGTFCYTGPIRTYDREVNGERVSKIMNPRIILNNGGLIITAIPSSKGCK